MIINQRLSDFLKPDSLRKESNMKKLIVILSMLLLGCVIGFAGIKQQVPKNKVIAPNPNTTTFKENETIVIDSTKLKELKFLIKDSVNYKKELGILESEVSSLKQQIANNKRNIASNKYLLFVLAVLIIAGLVFFLIDKKKRRDEVLYTLTGKKGNKEIHRLSEWEDEIIEKAVEKAKQIPLFAPGLQSNNIELKHTIEDLQKRIATLEDDNRTKPNEISNQNEEQTNVEISVPSTKTLYADAIINGVLNKVTEQPNDDTVYELFLKTPTDITAELAIYRDAYRRVLKNTDFIDGCEKQRINNTSNDLLVEKGEVNKQDTGKWQVTKKASVKFV